MEERIVSRLKLICAALGLTALAVARPREAQAALNSNVKPQLTAQEQIDELRTLLGTTRTELATLQTQFAAAQKQLAGLATHTHLYDPPHDNATATLADINEWNKLNINQTNMTFMMHTGGLGHDALTGPPVTQ